MRGVARALLAGEMKRFEGKGVLEILTKVFWEVGHGLPGSCFAAIKPDQQLGNTIRGAFPLLELLLKFLQGLRFNVALHWSIVVGRLPRRKRLPECIGRAFRI